MAPVGSRPGEKGQVAETTLAPELLSDAPSSLFLPFSVPASSFPAHPNSSRVATQITEPQLPPFFNRERNSDLVYHTEGLEGINEVIFMKIP